MRSRNAARLVGCVGALITVAALAGCGGSGGGAPQATFSVSTNAIAFQAASQTAAAPPPKYLTGTVTGSTSGTLYVVIANSAPSVATVGSVFFTSASSGQASVTPALPASLGIGEHASTITVRACLNDPTCATGELSGSPQVVAVTYTVPGIRVDQSSWSFTLGDAPLPAELARQATVTGAPVQDWTASSNVPWLSLSPASDNTAAAAALSGILDATQIDAMNNGTYRGAVQITPTVGLTVTIPVTLIVDRVQVSHVAPYVAYTGRSAEVVIRGENLDRMTIQGVSFGAYAATSFTVVSATEVRAVVPALPAGTHPVSLQNSQGFTRSLATLVVVDAPVYVATTLAYPVTANNLAPFGLAYDAERRALVVTWHSFTWGVYSLLFHYAYSGSAWGAPTQVPVPGATTVALSVDGSKWWVGTHADSSEGGVTTNPGIAPVGATDLAVGTTIQTGIGPGGDAFVESLAVTNDGDVIVAFSETGATVIPWRFSSTDLVFSSIGLGGAFGGTAASGDGSRALIGSWIGNQIYDYDASTGAAAAASITFTPVIRTAPALSRDGARFVLNDGSGLLRVFQGVTALGTLPTSTIQAVLSPAGDRAYTLDTSGKLRTFDLSVAAPFPELGTAGGITLAGSPGTRSTAIGLGIRMIISPDGGTIFLAGGDRIVIQPVP